jgi:LysM repeat protein
MPPPTLPTFPPPTDGARGPIDADCNYRVVAGDRLFRIALRFNRTVKQLADANHLADPGLLRLDQILRIPDCLAR